MKLLWLAFSFWLLVSIGSASEIQTNALSLSRVTLAVLPPHNASGDTNLAHWQASLGNMLVTDFQKTRAVRVLPDSSIDYARAMLQLSDDEAITATDARNLGKEIEARRVIWGEYDQHGATKKLTMRVLNVANGRIVAERRITGGNWREMVSEMALHILKELRVKITVEEEKKVKHLSEMSPATCELVSQSYWGWCHGQSLSNLEASLRRAIELSPHCDVAWQALANLQLLENKLEEAEDSAVTALQIAPDRATVHTILADIYSFKDRTALAEKEYLKAAQLSPDDAERFNRLGFLSAKKNRYKESISYLQSAVNLCPYAPSAHAKLGQIYAAAAQAEKAQVELKLAEKYLLKDDMDVESDLMRGFAGLHEFPEAIKHGEKFIALAEKQGVHLTIEETRAYVTECKAHLAPRFVSADAPHDYSPEELKTALRSKLNPDELRLVTNPIISSVEMKQWAKELTAGATNELDLTKRLFEGVTRRLSVQSDPTGDRTAAQVFKDWNQPGVRFSCQEYTFLFVALARELGLKAYYVIVDRDCYGRVVPHACAGVLVDGKALLVDATYLWLGVPHQEFHFKDDLEVMGIYLCQLQNVDMCRVTVKLMPDLAFGHFNLALELARQKKPIEALREIDAGWKLDKNNWHGYLAKAYLAATQEHWQQAIDDLNVCIALNPNLPCARFLLGEVLTLAGSNTEAREAFRAYLQGDTEPACADTAREAIAAINEQERVPDNLIKFQ